MTITIEVDGMAQVEAALKKYARDADQEIAKAVTGTALEMIGDVKKAIQRGPKTGRVYRRGNITHQASAPGEAPATDQGALASSVYFEQTTKLSATIGSRLAYAYYLEFGTSRIAPRPSWTPAAELAQGKLTKRIEKALKDAAR